MKKGDNLLFFQLQYYEMNLYEIYYFDMKRKFAIIYEKMMKKNYNKKKYLIKIFILFVL